MVQSISQVRNDTTTSAPPPPPTPPSNYASDWRAQPTVPVATPQPTPAPQPTPTAQPGPAPSPSPSATPSPSPGPAPTPPPVAPTAAPAVDLTERAQTSALLSADVYNDIPNPPAGYRVATQAELDSLGITPAMLEQPGSSFRARIYATDEGGQTSYTIAFRGSSSGEDWQNNFQQGLGMDSESYRKALDIGRVIAQGDVPVTMTGHSLGGGLASAAAIAAGRPADTFNAAGLHDDSIETAQIIARQYGQGEAQVEAYRVPGEILTFVQEGGDRILGGIFGGIVGVFVADAPEAYGNHHDLPEVVPEGKSWFAEHSRIDRHMIDWVLAGAAAL